MPKLMYHLHWPPVFLLFLTISHHSEAEVGTAAQYGPPSLPNACYGNDPGQFPSSNLFANRGSRGRDMGQWGHLWATIFGEMYKWADQGTCVPEQVIQVRIVDFSLTVGSLASEDGTTMVLSDTAFGTIANFTASSINIEFQQYVSLSLLTFGYYLWVG